MKSVALFAVLSLGFAINGFAANNLCPADTIELVSCIADAGLPYFPFASICQDSKNQEALFLDPGATNAPFIYAVEKSEDAEHFIWSGADENSGPLQFLVKKNAANIGILRIDMGMGGGPEDMTYTCGK